MTASRMIWEEIKKLYDQEWVELVDYDWPEEDIYPRAGIVRVHAKTRLEFDNLADNDPPVDSAYVFVGPSEKQSENVVITRGYSNVIMESKHA